MAITLLAQGANGSGTSKILQTVTPSPGSTIVVFHGGLSSTAAIPTFGISDDAGGVWVKAATAGTATTTKQEAVAWYQNNVSGVPIVITLTTSPSMDQQAYQIVELPINITKLGATATISQPSAPDLTNMNMTLSATPLSTSYILGNFSVDGSTSGTFSTTPGTGFTTLSTVSDTSIATGSTVEYVTGVTSTAVGWVDAQSGTMGIFSGAGIALEFQLTGGDSGFVDITNGADTTPFASGDQIGYTTPTLTNTTTYFWRVRGKDPTGTGTFGAWATTRSFTVSTASGPSPTGIASTATIGVPTLQPGSVTISPTGKASTLTIGVPTLQPGAVTISPTAIASTLTIGAPTLSSSYTISPTALASTATIGSPTLQPGSITISPTAIASTATIGAPTLSSSYTILPTALASTATIGVPTLQPGAVTISPTGVASTLTIGAPSVTSAGAGSQTINTTGIASTATIGAPTLAPGAATISPTALASTLTFGAPTMQPGSVTISTTGIASTATIGSPTVTSVYTISPAAITSTTAIGSPTLSPGAVTISLSAISSTATIGTVSVLSVTTISATGIASTAVLGSPTITFLYNLFVTGLASTNSFGVPSLGNSTQVIHPRSIGGGRKYYIDSDANVYWVVNQRIGLVEPV